MLGGRYGKQMKTLQREGRWAKVLQMLDTLVVEDVKVNVILCNIAISILGETRGQETRVLGTCGDFFCSKSCLKEVVLKIRWNYENSYSYYLRLAIVEQFSRTPLFTKL